MFSSYRRCTSIGILISLITPSHKKEVMYGLSISKMSIMIFKTSTVVSIFVVGGQHVLHVGQLSLEMVNSRVTNTCGRDDTSDPHLVCLSNRSPIFRWRMTVPTCPRLCFVFTLVSGIVSLPVSLTGSLVSTVLFLRNQVCPSLNCP